MCIPKQSNCDFGAFPQHSCSPTGGSLAPKVHGAEGSKGNLFSGFNGVVVERSVLGPGPWSPRGVGAWANPNQDWILGPSGGGGNISHGPE